MIKTNVAKFALAAAALATSTVAFADASEPQTLDFAYSPVELQDEQSAAQLEERIRKFARNACRSASVLVTSKMRRECREDITQQIQEKIAG